jgi:hypothetical protein
MGNGSLDVIALANSNPPLLTHDYNRIERDVSKEFRWYLIGLTCSLAAKGRLQPDGLNKLLTNAQVAKNSGYSTETMKRFMNYANSIGRLEKSLPGLAADILAGKTRLGLKTTILIAKLPPNDISEIIKRVESEDTSIRKIIAEHTKRPLSYPRRFSDGRSTKDTPKSVKDIPRHDPDALIAGITFTIPSWVKAINRVHINTSISQTAKNKLSSELSNLYIAVEALIELLTEAY